MRKRKPFEEPHELSFILLPQEHFARTIFGVRLFFRKLPQGGLFPVLLTPALDTFLMGDAENPAAEFSVISQGMDVS